MKLSGVWLPIVTPFLDGEIDYESYERLINHYVDKKISGLIPLGTTGESPAVSEYEFERIIDKTLVVNDGRVPVYIGVGSNSTNKVLKKLEIVKEYKIDGILSVCPYYNLPNQNGLLQHFLKIAEATDLNILIYNIPYRTGVNLQNETLFKLAGQKNIIALKDSCGNIRQTLELLSNKPDNLSVLAGEDLLFYTTVVNGGEGGILASAHLHTEIFIDIYNLLKENDHQAALRQWRKIVSFIPLLFEEPNPAPIKYCLSSLGLINSSETRLPLTGISDKLKGKLDRILS
jgi:4-hydroxy-tetrahydrodipicolinate synthase